MEIDDLALYTVQRNGTDRAANTEFSETVPTGKAWYVMAVSVSLVQGLTQTPQPILIIDDGVDVIFESYGSTGTQAVSTTCRYTWAPGLTISAQIGATTAVHSIAPLPRDLYLLAGWRIRSSTIGIGANSDYGAPSLYMAEFDI